MSVQNSHTRLPTLFYLNLFNSFNISFSSDKYETKFKNMTREMNNLKIDHMNLLNEFDKVFNLNKELNKRIETMENNNEAEEDADVLEQVQTNVVSNTHESDLLQVM